MTLSKADNIYVWDDQGRQYIEGFAGLWCTALGYGNEEVAQAGYEQMKSLSFGHLFAGKGHETATLLAEKLKAMVPGGFSKVFFGLSGSDANDTQIKLVRYYNNAMGRPQKKKIIGRVKGYHGITIAAGSLTGLPQFHSGFDLPIDGVLHTDAPFYYRFAEPGESEEDFASRLAAKLEELILSEGPDTVAAFIAEPIMGAGGVLLPPRTYFEKVQAVLRKHDVLFIDDEVICGFGRTGNPFGAQTFGLEPDTMSLAKALTSAYAPLSAVMVPGKMFNAMVDAAGELGVFAHGFTYSGHPLSTAVALKVLEIYERDKILEHAAEVSGRFQQRLRGFADHPLVGDARGIGLVGACELVANKTSKAMFEPPGSVGAYCLERCHEHGLISRAIGEVMVVCPPLIITEEQIDEMFDRYGKALDETLDWVTREGLLAA
jgi:4-aminobutyrate--pyruvate transaminase